jgi:type I restriction enzyme M protein
LFLHLFLRLLENGGRAAVIVPDGILFGSTRAHVEIRRQLIEENRLEAVISMPAGVFRPYAGVSAAVLLFTKGAATERVWFYDMEYDGFSLDDKRQRVLENDIPDILASWRYRFDAEFQKKREARLLRLRELVAPLKLARLEQRATVHRLRFEEAVTAAMDEVAGRRIDAEERLAALQAEITPVAAEINQLCRQFWVTGDQIAANKYDLSANRYRLIERDDEFFEPPGVTIERLAKLEAVSAEIRESIGQMLGE